MRITMIGTGYVGLVTGACFADFGVNVTCVDIDEKKISSLRKGDIPFYEPGLQELVEKNSNEGRLNFTTSLREGIEDSIAVFICVGTPPKEDGSADLRFVEGVAGEIARNLNDYKVVVTKSTVPVGTGKRIKEIIVKESGGDKEFDVVSNPEFLREGAAIEDFVRPNRIVIGSDSERAIAIMKDLYRPLYLIETPFVVTNIETSELIKYAANAFLATKISYINELANLCEQVNANVHDVAKGMGLDNRIGRKFLHPGPGFGGSCFPKDTLALKTLASDKKVELGIVSAAIQANHRQKEIMVSKIKKRVGSVKEKVFAFLGLSFKPNTDDLREAPSLFIIETLLKEGAVIRAYDPVGMENCRSVLKDVYYAEDPYDAITDADVAVLVTEWNQFRNLDLEKIKRFMKSSVFFDLRNVYEPSKMKELGFDYHSVGREIH